MSITFNSSMSGIRAALDMLNASSHAIANVSNESYKKQFTDLSKDNHGGQAEIYRTENSKPGSFYKNIEGDVVEGSKVNFFEEIVVQIRAKNLLYTNITEIKRKDDAQKSLVDITA